MNQQKSGFTAGLFRGSYGNMLLSYTGIIIFCFIIISGCAINDKIADGILNAKTIAFLLSIGIMLLFWGIAGLLKTDKIKLNLLDLVIILFFTWIITNNSFHDFKFSLKKNMEEFGLLLYYLYSKKIFSKRENANQLLLLFLLLLILTQIGTAALQLFDYLPSFNSSFRFTGFFFNPSPFAIFLSAITISGFAVLIYTCNKIVKTIFSLLFLLSVPIIIISQARSAWIGFFFGILVILFFKYRGSVLFIKIKNAGFKASLVLIPLIAVALYFLYHFKQKSADGRLLIWKLSMTMIKDRPVFGTGAGGVQAYFLKYQAQYFRSFPDKIATEGKLSGQVWYCFNDLLQIFVEHGLVGVLLFGTILIFFVKYALNILNGPVFQKSKNGSILILGAISCPIVILGAGLFAYPLSMLPIQIIFYGALGIISANYDMLVPGNSNNLICSTKWVFLRRYLSLVALFFLGVCYLKFSLALFKVYKLGYEPNNLPISENTVAKLENYQFIISREPWYILGKCGYLLNLGKYHETEILLEEAEKNSSDTRIYYLLGNLYMFRKEYAKAEGQYQFLKYALPNLLKPKYCLQKLYLETGQQEKWQKETKEIIDFKPKFPAQISDGWSF